MEQQRSGALVLRVWTEHEDAFRARLTAIDTSLGASEERTIATVASERELIDAVRLWLDEFLYGAVRTD